MPLISIFPSIPLGDCAALFTIILFVHYCARKLPINIFRPPADLQSILTVYTQSIARFAHRLPHTTGNLPCVKYYKRRTRYGCVMH